MSAFGGYKTNELVVLAAGASEASPTVPKDMPFVVKLGKQHLHKNFVVSGGMSKSVCTPHAEVTEWLQANMPDRFLVLTGRNVLCSFRNEEDAALFRLRFVATPYENQYSFINMTLRSLEM